VQRRAEAARLGAAGALRAFQALAHQGGADEEGAPICMQQPACASWHQQIKSTSSLHVVHPQAHDAPAPPCCGPQVVEAVAARAVHANVVTAMCGVAKMYVGEVVEVARAAATRAGHYGPLLPAHIYQAYHALQAAQPAPAKRPRLFR
jgi:hTAFII28-like protein conserved region